MGAVSLRGVEGACATCGRKVVGTVFEDEDIQYVSERAKFGYVISGLSPSHVDKCQLCHHTERRLEAYLLVGGEKARAFVTAALEKTATAVDNFTRAFVTAALEKTATAVDNFTRADWPKHWKECVCGHPDVSHTSNPALYNGNEHHCIALKCACERFELKTSR
jgi:hypothetical protein